jgi:acetyl-CoA acetyltransferase
VADRDRAAVHVELFFVKTECARAGHHLRAKRLVNLEAVDVRELQPFLLDHCLDRRHWADTHDFRRDACCGTGDEARELGIEPLGAFVASAVAGVDPRLMGIGPVPAVRKLLERTGLTVGDLDLVELNEAFASQSLAVIRDLGLDEEKVNVNGGAIAIGHPLGMSGARLVVTLLHELRRRGGRYGVATMCVGVGQGQAALFDAA